MPQIVAEFPFELGETDRGQFIALPQVGGATALKLREAGRGLFILLLQIGRAVALKPREPASQVFNLCGGLCVTVAQFLRGPVGLFGANLRGAGELRHLKLEFVNVEAKTLRLLPRGGEIRGQRPDGIVQRGDVGFRLADRSFVLATDQGKILEDVVEGLAQRFGIEIPLEAIHPFAQNLEVIHLPVGGAFELEHDIGDGAGICRFILHILE